MNTKPQYFQIQFKSVESTGKATKIEGYASTPDPDRYDDIVDPKAFMEALDLYMKNPVLLLQHNMERTVGTISKAQVDDKGLLVGADVNDEETQGKIARLELRAFSIGFIPLEVMFKHKETGMEISLDSYNSLYWEDMKKYYRVIKKLDLAEISIVSVPANGHALFTVQKSLKSYFDGITKKEGVFPANETEGAKSEDDEEVEETEETEDLEEKIETTETAEVEKPVDPAAPTDPVEPAPVETTEEKAPIEEPAPIENQTATAPENAGGDPAPVVTPPAENTPGAAAPVGTEKALDLDQKALSPIEAKELQVKLATANDANLILVKTLLEAQRINADLKALLDKTPNLKGLIHGITPDNSGAKPEEKQHQPGALLTGMLQSVR